MEERETPDQHQLLSGSGARREPIWSRRRHYSPAIMLCNKHLFHNSMLEEKEAEDELRSMNLSSRL